MLTIKNLKKLEGFKVVVRGFEFEVVDTLEKKDTYEIGLWYNKGTAHSPIILTICREPEIFEEGTLKKYIVRKGGHYPKYISNVNYCTPYELMKFISEYLNNI